LNIIGNSTLTCENIDAIDLFATTDRML